MRYESINSRLIHFWPRINWKRRLDSERLTAVKRSVVVFSCVYSARLLTAGTAIRNRQTLASANLAARTIGAASGRTASASGARGTARSGMASEHQVGLRQHGQRTLSGRILFFLLALTLRDKSFLAARPTGVLGLIES